MNIKRLLILTGTVFLGLTLVSIWIWSLSEPLVSAQAAGTWYVASSGSDSNSCLSTTAPCVTDYKANANVYYVCAGTGCGISTTHSTINDALAVTISGDSIYVAEGNYTESITLTESISLQGGWSRDFAVYSPTLNTSTIQGSGNQPVIRIEGGAAPLVQGFTITGGGTNYQNQNGAGISITGSSGTIVENRIVQNTSNYNGGGGISIGVDSSTNPVIIANNEIVSNTSGNGGGGIRAYASAGGKVIIQHNVIRGNVSEYGEGGGLSLGTFNNPISSIIIDGNIIIANQSDYGYGGGVYMESRGISLTNNIIANNIATFGGGVYTIGGNPGASWLTNNTIVDNEGDGIAVTNPFETVIHLTNNIIANNTRYGIDCDINPSTAQTVSYNDVWGNLSGNYYGQSLPDQTDTNGNISIDPHFVDPSNGDWHLQTCSPAVDAGTNTGAPSIDFEGDVRPFNGVTDMGADEYVGGECFRNFLPCVTNNYCPPLYSDDFSDPNSGWPVGDDGNIRYEYLNGEYRIKVYNDWWAAAHPGFQASDYILAADVRVPGGYGSYGLIFGISGDWSQFYTFEIDKVGNYGMYRYDSGSWTLLAEGWSVEINTDTNVKNRLKIKREGTLIEAYANGHLLASISDGAYTGMRYMGLFINNYNLGGFEVMFDDFVVYPVWCSIDSAQIGETFQTPSMKSLESIEQGQIFSQPNNRKR